MVAVAKKSDLEGENFQLPQLFQEGQGTRDLGFHRRVAPSLRMSFPMNLSYLAVSPLSDGGVEGPVGQRLGCHHPPPRPVCSRMPAD